MSKPPIQPIPSDDCAVTVGGTVYYPHEGETVTAMPGLSVREMLLIADFQRLGIELEAAKGEADEGARTMGALNRTFTGLCEFVAGRLIAWTWTDNANRPLPPPTDPMVIQGLTNDEVMYLLDVVKGEPPAAKKNALARSPITSSATTRAPTPLSNGGRSRGKAS